MNLSQAEEFLVYGMKYVFPAQLGGPARGVATAWAAEPLRDEIVQADGELLPVWRDAQGTLRGLSLAPLHGTVAEASRRDRQLAERLALVDAIRVGNARIRKVAAQMLRAHLDRAPT